MQHRDAKDANDRPMRLPTPALRFAATAAQARRRNKRRRDTSLSKGL